MVTNAIPLGVYRHYKGNQYEVIGFAKRNETLEDMVMIFVTKSTNRTFIMKITVAHNQNKYIN
jgi:hypothetical protein